MLTDQLQADLNASLKAGKADRVETLRFLIAGVRNSVIAKYGADWEKKITDADVIEVVKKQIKTHNESIDVFTKAGRQELVDREKAQLAVLTEFAPKEMSDDDLKKLLAPIAASAREDLPAGRQDFGLLMKQAMSAVKGQADGGRVSAVLKQMI